jgi:hypothetical protein
MFLLLFVVVTYLTVTPNPGETEGAMDFARWIAEVLFGDALYGDKVAHFLAYGALGASAALAQVKIAQRPVVTVAALALYGASLEGVQAIGAVRQPELLDAFANALGALLAYPAAMLAIEFARARARA